MRKDFGLGHKENLRGRKGDTFLPPKDNVATKLTLQDEAGRALQPHNRVDYWFYIRNTNTQKKETSNE